MTLKPAAFLDRDGTIIIDKHYQYKVEDLEFLPDAISALKTLVKNNYLIFIVTNQSGVGRGIFKTEDLEKFHQKLAELLNSEDIPITDISVCPHTPQDNCDCRKPEPKMILDLIKKHKNIDIEKSFMCGDKTLDAQSGINAGIKGYHLKDKTLLQVVNEHLALSK